MRPSSLFECPAGHAGHRRSKIVFTISKSRDSNQDLSFSKHLMFEQKSDPLLTRPQFAWRMVRSIGVASIVLIFSLAIGSVGYHYYCELPWVDALLNASMILTGMGPVEQVKTTSAKLFATAYALYSGVAFLTIMAVLLAPVAHRFIHHFNLEDESDSEK